MTRRFEFTGTSGRYYSLPMAHSPGKFEGEPRVASALHSLSLEGMCDTLGDVSEIGWHSSLIEGPITEDEISAHETVAGELSKLELDALADCAGAIITEDGQGFIYLTLYGQASELMFDWECRSEDWERTLECECEGCAG